MSTTIGIATLLSAVAVIGSTPAFGHDGSGTSSVTDKHIEQIDIAKLKADVTRVQLDLSALPPEINSMRMYAGAGSGPMLAAAAAWDALASELEATAKSYETVITGLASESSSSSESSVNAAAASYVSWLKTEAQEAEVSAAQARTEAAQFVANEKTPSTG